jgi:hypothetical protein
MENEMECIREFKAFAKGGASGLGRLVLVYKNVLKEYDIDEDRLESLLGKAGLYKELATGLIVAYPQRS